MKKQQGNKLGMLVAERHGEYGLYQYQTAKKAGVSLKTVGNIEAGHQVELPTVVKVLSALNISLSSVLDILPDDLRVQAEQLVGLMQPVEAKVVTGKGRKPKPMSPEDQQINALVSKMNPAGKTRAIKMLRLLQEG